MIENQIRTWIEEQLALGEEPEILRQTLLELDIDEDEIMALIPKNTVKQENHTEDVKTEQEKIMKQIIPEITTPPKPKMKIVNMPNKNVVDLPEPPTPTQIIDMPITKLKSDVPKKGIINYKLDNVNPEDKKIGSAKLKMISLHAQHGMDSKTSNMDKLKSKKHRKFFGKFKRFFAKIFHKTKKSTSISENKKNIQLGRAKLKMIPVHAKSIIEKIQIKKNKKNDIILAKQTPIKQNIKITPENKIIQPPPKTQKNIETSKNNEKTQTREIIKQNKTNVGSYFVEMVLSLIVFLLQICNTIISSIIKIFSFLKKVFKSKTSIIGLILIVLIYVAIMMLNKYAETKVSGLI